MINFLTLMRDECGDEFAVTIPATSKDAAYDKAKEDYPECGVIRVESPRDVETREYRLYVSVSEELDNDY